MSSVETREQRGTHRGEVIAARDRHQMLPSDGLSPRLDAAFIVASARPAEARLEQIVRREGLEARGELPLGANENFRHCRLQIVVRDALRHASEVLERAHVSVEKAQLILPRAEPREVAARVHQAHHEHPRFLPLAGEVDEHLEEIDLREISRRIHERHKHLAAATFPLANGLGDRGDPDLVPLADEHRVQPRRR